MKKLYFYILIILTIFTAMILSVLPIPEIATMYWPEWVLLTVIYWCLAIPTKLNITFAWIVGLSIDLLNGYILGQHALAYTIVAATAIYFHTQIRAFPTVQQSFSIGALLVLYFFIKAWIDGVMHPDILSWRQWLPALTSIVVWPWVFFMLRLMRHKISPIN